MVTPGARFAQLQPVKAFATGGNDATAAPYTLFTVPTGATYRLRYTSVSLVVAADSTFTHAGGAGAFITVQDSLGNKYAECESFIAQAGQNCPNQGFMECDNAVLPAGTVVTLAYSGAALGLTGFYVRMGGGAVWRLA